MCANKMKCCVDLSNDLIFNYHFLLQLCFVMITTGESVSFNTWHCWLNCLFSVFFFLLNLLAIRDFYVFVITWTYAHHFFMLKKMNKEKLFKKNKAIFFELAIFHLLLSNFWCCWLLCLFVVFIKLFILWTKCQS